MTAVLMEPEPARPDPWKVLGDSLSPRDRRGELLEDLRENLSWMGALKKLRVAFPDNAGIVASCDGFILWHLSEIERLSRELKNAGN